MKIGESESELAVYDSLISGLADHAVNSDPTADLFFAKMGQVIEAIFAPKWSVVLARGPADSLIPIYSTGGAKERLGGILLGSGKKECDHLVGIVNRGDELRESGVIVSSIAGASSGLAEGESDLWGCIVVDVGGEPVDLVQSNVMTAIAETAQELSLIHISEPTRPY